MRISFTGAGCSGKSTLLKMCQDYYGDRFEYVTEVTRPIARKGLKINEEGGDETQRAIIEAHIQNDRLDDVIMDRCIVDGYAYTNWLFGQGKVTEETYQFAWTTLKAIINNIDIIFYTKPVEMEDDGERSTNVNFQKDIDDIMSNLLDHCWRNDVRYNYFTNKLVILRGDVDKRFNDIKIAIEQHEHTAIR